MKTIVVSAVNLRKGGTLTILRDCLAYLSQLNSSNQYRIIALVHKRELALFDSIEYIEIPWTIKSWILRLWCEYITMFRISKQIGSIDLWLSLHDTTPNVVAKRRAVYCHNPFPFYKWKWSDIFVNYHITCFAWFSKYIYRINIHKNDWVLVQQSWIRNEFIKLFDIVSQKIVVTPPGNSNPIPDYNNDVKQDRICRFIFPSYADIHKNFEVACQAAAALEQEVGPDKFRLTLTLDQSVNKYAKWLFKKWGHIKSIEFAGFLSREMLYQCYHEANCLIFPSKVETWGLAISEFGAFDKPMILADLPYAHETSAGCSMVSYFEPDDAEALKNRMRQVIEGNLEGFAPNPGKAIEPPVTHNWEELFALLLE